MKRFDYVLMEDEPGAAGGGAEAPVTPPAGAPDESNWYDTLPQDMREDQNITKFDSMEAMGKSWLNAQRLIGADKIPMPQTDEDWGNTFNRLGRPEEASGYTLAAPEGVQVNEEAQSKFLEMAHRVGLSQKQVQDIADWDVAEKSAATEAHDSATESATNEAINGLKTEWGAAFDQNVGIANRAINEFVNETELSFLQDKSIDGVKLADHPVMVKFFANVGKGMMESGKLEGVGSEQAMTPTEMQEKANTLMSNTAYTDNRHPEHKQLVRQVTQLFEQMATS